MTVMLRHIPEKALSMNSPFHFSDREQTLEETGNASAGNVAIHGIRRLHDSGGGE
jgi:hypothetical protein